MDITIIGTGNMARGIATRALAGGHAVTLLGTEIEKAQALARELAGDVRAGQVEAGRSRRRSLRPCPGAKVVKAFNTTFAGTLVEGKVAGHALDVFIASDDEGAKSAVQQLAADGGLRPIDVGPLALAHHLEALGYLNMAIQPSLGTNYGSAIEVLA
jgi:predicted dinucleotide-binding enzyme